MAEQKKHVPISKLVLEAKRCPISGLWPHLYPTPDGTYYFTCSPLCPWDASKSTSYSALCTYEKNTYKPVYTGAHAHADISDAVAEWNDLMTAKTKYEKGDDTMLKVNPCPISGLTPEPNHWADDAWFYECDSRCPRIKDCRLATPVYVHQTDAEAGWNRLIKDVTAGEAGLNNSGRGPCFEKGRFLKIHIQKAAEGLNPLPLLFICSLLPSERRSPDRRY